MAFKAWFYVVFCLILASGCENPALAKAIPKIKAVKAVIGESENQGARGMLYVSCAIRNRGTLSGVFGLNSPRVKHKLYSQKIYAEALKAWIESADPDNCVEIDGAKNWENTNAFGLPYWAVGKQIVFVYLDHKFFK